MYLFTGEFLAGFLVAVFPALLFLVVWGLVSAARLLVPERPLPSWAEAPWEGLYAGRTHVPASLRRIQADVKAQAQKLVLPYRYALNDRSDGLPDGWREDLMSRRN